MSLYRACEALLQVHLYRLQHFINMALDLYLAPFSSQFAAAVDQERAAFDAHDLAAVHVLFLDDIE